MNVNHQYERTNKISSNIGIGVLGNLFDVKVVATCEMYALC
jgi:hypothetical protein